MGVWGMLAVRVTRRESIEIAEPQKFPGGIAGDAVKLQREAKCVDEERIALRVSAYPKASALRAAAMIRVLSGM